MALPKLFDKPKEEITPTQQPSLPKAYDLFGRGEVLAPQQPDEFAMFWGCGVTPQTVAMESKVPFMISHCPGYMFITDKLTEELAIL